MAPELAAVKVVDALRTALVDLARYETEVPYDRLCSDRDAWRMVRQALQEALQASIDLGQHLLARGGHPVPESYRATFTALRDHLGLPDDLATPMADAAGLRNVLVHVYTELDLRVIHPAYTTNREVLERWLRWVAAELARVPGPP